MRCRTLSLLLLAIVTASSLSVPRPADAQILDRLKKAAQNAVEDEAQAQVERLIRNAIRCAVDDPICYEEANTSGEEVIFVDAGGEIIADEDGVPITDREQAMASAPPPPAPGEGAWANYDFVPGEEVLLYDDFSGDNVGDFPRRFDLVQGNWEIVDWAGGRYLRAVSNGLIAIPLPRTLPEQFTFETAVNLTHGNAFVRVVPGRAYYGPARSYQGSAVSVEATRAGVRPVSNQGPTALAQFGSERVRDAVVALRIMADGQHMKVYLGEQRVANAPNAVFPRSDSLFLAVGSAAESHPVLIGPIRIAGGGADLYGRLARDGRVATQGILFATNSDRIRPESTPTLQEIGAMLQEHPELRLRIEGHTDSDGDEAYNQDLAERRAAAVKRFLVERYGTEEARLESAGFGESRPVADNDTPEGKQQNRRVELVRLEGG
jgi:outer membrane protein OmpA-like peptidoglycan-associated protein